MTKETAVKLFENKKVRTAWDSESEKWYISIVDTIAVLTESIDPTAYWRKLKQRLKAEGNETVTNCHGFISFSFYPLPFTLSVHSPLNKSILQQSTCHFGNPLCRLLFLKYNNPAKAYSC